MYYETQFYPRLIDRNKSYFPMAFNIIMKWHYLRTFSVCVYTYIYWRKSLVGGSVSDVAFLLLQSDFNGLPMGPYQAFPNVHPPQIPVPPSYESVSAWASFVSNRRVNPMKREQNNGQREGKVLINSSTSLVLALDCVAFTLSWKWSWWWQQHHWCQCFVCNSARIRRELQILESSSRALNHLFFLIM